MKRPPILVHMVKFESGGWAAGKAWARPCPHWNDRAAQPWSAGCRGRAHARFAGQGLSRHRQHRHHVELHHRHDADGRRRYERIEQCAHPRPADASSLFSVAPEGLTTSPLPDGRRLPWRSRSLRFCIFWKMYRQGAIPRVYPTHKNNSGHFKNVVAGIRVYCMQG